MTAVAHTPEVPVEPYDLGPGYGTGICVGNGPVATQEEVADRLAIGDPAWWPTVYIGDDGLVDLPGEHRMTRDHFAVWVAALSTALAAR